MAPKGSRSGSSGRPGARSNSSTKINANLQFTQKDLPAKHSDKQKKSAGYANDKVPLARVNSSHRVHSKEHIQPMKRGPSSQRANTHTTTKGRAGFTIAKDEDDDDEWVSSESGAATPCNNESDSDTTSEADAATHALYAQHTDNHRQPTLHRVETARPTEFLPRIVRHDTPTEPPTAKTPTLPAPAPFLQQVNLASDTRHPDVNQLQSQLRRMELDTTKETRTDPPPQPQPSARHSQHNGRRSRPASTYSQSGKELRPHPLIRGLSTGNVNMGRANALAPLTVATGAAPPQLSTSPASSVHDMATSPTSIATSMNEDPAAYLRDRRASVSSARSLATLPGQSLHPSSSTTLLDRARTLSLMSASPSSAALSALSHLPSVTRPPSPQAVVFFPPVNPHANVDAIHPLLPGPYLSNHLTVLARRNPLRESYDRVIRAKLEASNSKLQ